jgi:hypothetical protein
MREFRPAELRSCIAILAVTLVAPASFGGEEGEKDTPPPEIPGAKEGKKVDTKSAAEKKGAAKGGEKKASDKKAEKDAAAKAAEEADIKFVKEGLKQFVHGTVSFNEKNMVTITYDLNQKKEEYEHDFIPPISPRVPGNFRWSNRDEEFFSTGDQGIRISDSGMAVLNVWFRDDVEATMEFLNAIGWTKRQVCAIVLTPRNGQGIGNNFGGQCATFAGASFKGGVPPTTEQLNAEKRAKFGLRVGGGNFEAILNGKSRKSAKYNPKSLSSGRIGFVWDGKLAGTITTFSVTGMLDFAATAKEMRKPAPR